MVEVICCAASTITLRSFIGEELAEMVVNETSGSLSLESISEDDRREGEEG